MFDESKEQFDKQQEQPADKLKELKRLREKNKESESIRNELINLK